MIHLERELNGNEWKFILDSNQPIIHFFNEPERNGISPNKAADYWHKQVIPNPRNQHHKKLVSPSCASDPNGQKWIADWMHLVKDSPPDYVGIHWYGTSSDEAKKYIEAMHKKFPGKKIIVSEIASISRDKQDVYRFTQRMCNWMDEQDFIFEYGFFGCMRTMPNDFVSPEARLMNPDASFTDLMHNYMNQQPWK